MKVIKVILIIFSLILFSCQNRNQVTHNKRKYRKGYYKTNRAKVKPRKSKQEEISYQRSTSKGEEKQKEETPPKTYQNQKELASESSDPINSGKKLSRDDSDFFDKEQKTSTSQQERKNPGKIKKEADPDIAQKKRTNWIYWVCLALLILTLAAAALILLNILVFALIAIGLSAIGFTLSVINYRKYKSEPDTNFTKASSALMFAFFLVILVGGLLFIIITQTSF